MDLNQLENIFAMPTLVVKEFKSHSMSISLVKVSMANKFIYKTCDFLIKKI